MFSAPLGLHNSLLSSKGEKGDVTQHNLSFIHIGSSVLLIMFPSSALLLLRDTLVVEQDSIFGVEVNSLSW